MKLKNLIFISSIFVFILLISFNVDAVTRRCYDPFYEMQWDLACSNLLQADCNPTDCVTKGENCVAEGALHGTGSTIDDKWAVCVSNLEVCIPYFTSCSTAVGYWRDADNKSLYETVIGSSCSPFSGCVHVKCGESEAVCTNLGEYQDTTTEEFCGDDQGEYQRTTEIKIGEGGPITIFYSACCDSSTDCVGLDYKCLLSSNSFCSYNCYNDYDGDDYIANSCGGLDCNDNEYYVYPGAPERCDGIDNQCPGDLGYGTIDEGCPPPPTYYCVFSGYRQPSISSTCGLSCKQGDQITMKAYIDAPPEAECDYDFIINAVGEGCSIGPSGEDITGIVAGIDEVGPRNDYYIETTWTIPSIPGNCLGKEINPMFAWFVEKSTGTIVDWTSPVTGSFTFTSCGNYICETGEDYGNCPSDCPEGPYCGDGTCDPGECAIACSLDCNINDCCGNGDCDRDIGETPINCPSDCILPGTCLLEDAYWSSEGTVDDLETDPVKILPNNSLVHLVVLTTPDCDGWEINFDIWEDDLIGDDYVVSPGTAIIGETSTGKATQQWTTRWREDELGLPEFYFIGEIVGDSLSIQSGLIQVNKSEPSPIELCGNLQCDPDEECCYDDVQGYYCQPFTSGPCSNPPLDDCPETCCPSEPGTLWLCGGQRIAAVECQAMNTFDCCIGSCYLENDDGTSTTLTYGDCVDEDGDGYGIRDEITTIKDKDGYVKSTNIEQRECTVITEVAVSFFTWTNLLIVIIIIAAYYAYVTTRKKKKK